MWVKPVLLQLKEWLSVSMVFYQHSIHPILNAFGFSEWTAAYLLLVLGWIFAPVFLGAKLQTIPEYLERRFNKHCRLAHDMY